MGGCGLRRALGLTPGAHNRRACRKWGLVRERVAWALVVVQMVVIASVATAYQMRFGMDYVCFTKSEREQVKAVEKFLDAADRGATPKGTAMFEDVTSPDFIAHCPTGQYKREDWAALAPMIIDKETANLRTKVMAEDDTVVAYGMVAADGDHEYASYSAIFKFDKNGNIAHLSHMRLDAHGVHTQGNPPPTSRDLEAERNMKSIVRQISLAIEEGGASGASKLRDGGLLAPSFEFPLENGTKINRSAFLSAIGDENFKLHRATREIFCDSAMLLCADHYARPDGDVVLHGATIFKFDADLDDVTGMFWYHHGSETLHHRRLAVEKVFKALETKAGAVFEDLRESLDPGFTMYTRERTYDREAFLMQLSMAPKSDASRKLVAAGNFVFDIYSKVLPVGTSGESVTTTGVAYFEFGDSPINTKIKNVGWYYDDTLTERVREKLMKTFDDAFETQDSKVALAEVRESLSRDWVGAFNQYDFNETRLEHYINSDGWNATRNQNSDRVYVQGGDIGLVYSNYSKGVVSQEVVAVHRFDDDNKIRESRWLIQEYPQAYQDVIDAYMEALYSGNVDVLSSMVVDEFIFHMDARDYGKAEWLALVSERWQTIERNNHTYVAEGARVVSIALRTDPNSSQKTAVGMALFHFSRKTETAGKLVEVRWYHDNDLMNDSLMMAAKGYYDVLEGRKPTAAMDDIVAPGYYIELPGSRVAEDGSGAVAVRANITGVMDWFSSHRTGYTRHHEMVTDRNASLVMNLWSSYNEASQKERRGVTIHHFVWSGGKPLLNISRVFMDDYPLSNVDTVQKFYNAVYSSNFNALKDLVTSDYTAYTRMGVLNGVDAFGDMLTKMSETTMPKTKRRFVTEGSTVVAIYDDVYVDKEDWGVAVHDFSTNERKIKRSSWFSNRTSSASANGGADGP